MEFDLAFFALSIPAVIFAGISKGGFGSGAAFAGSSILALVLDPSIAVGLMLPLLMLMDISALKAFWGRWDWGLSWRVIAGSIPGVVLGTLLFQSANDDVIRLLIGVISLAFVAWQMITKLQLIKARRKPFGPIAGWITGAIAGFTSFVSHAGGPPVAVYLLSHPVSKTTYQASTVLIFWVVNITKAVPYGIIGMFTYESLLADLYLAPFALFGVWLGVKAHNVIPERPYFVFTYILLTLTGSKLIWDALV